MRFRTGAAAALALSAALPSPGLAWGAEGHILIAAIARARLTPATRAKVDAILAEDHDTLTPPDMLSRATWADAWRGAGHRETAQWHFVDIELDHPDVDAACFGHPAAATPTSAGPADACIIDRLEQFSAELAAPGTAPAERILALKYVLHLVGDLHQPLHVADNHDHGANCVNIALGGQRSANLHGYWDTIVVRELGDNPDALAAELESEITPARAASWAQGDVASWAREAHALAVSTAYSFHTVPRCARDDPPVDLPKGYDAVARPVVRLQLERAGVRLAAILERDLGPLPGA